MVIILILGKKKVYLENIKINIFDEQLTLKPHFDFRT